MEWSGVLSSTTVSCVFSAIPIPTGKTAIAAMVGGAGLSAAEAFSVNVLSQYSLLRNSYSNPKTILEKIKWEESFKEAGSSGVITFISTVLIRGGSHGTVLALKNRIVNIAEKKGSNYVRTKLLSLGFTDDFIDKIFVKWGVSEIKALPNLPFIKPFSVNNYRDNLKILTGKNPPSSIHAHHVFPKGTPFTTYFLSVGIDINDPRFLQWWDTAGANGHLKKVSEYNSEWREFFSIPSNIDKVKILRKGKELMAKYGLNVNY
ncbi:MAG: hypothetical protein ACK4LB_05630 [Spirosomataceae bacterium]